MGIWDELNKAFQAGKRVEIKLKKRRDVSSLKIFFVGKIKLFSPAGFLFIDEEIQGQPEILLFFEEIESINIIEKEEEEDERRRNI